MELQQVDTPDEVSFANHINEFRRFYNRHKTLCDEITGIKKRRFVEDSVEKEISVGKLNFIKAIKGLSSFIIDNIHYIVDEFLRNQILSRISELESDFIDNKKYQEFAESSDLNEADTFEFNKLYFKYVFDCFELSYDTFKALQDSLMIATKDIRKSIKFFDSDQFFENLSKYRDEISNNLADFKLKNSFIHFKKVVGYHYTYRFIVSKEVTDYIDELINLIYSYLLSKEVMESLNEAKQNDITDLNVLHKRSSFIKKVLFEIYFETNKSLSDRNILPKPDKKILIDKTLI